MHRRGQAQCSFPPNRTRRLHSSFLARSVAMASRLEESRDGWVTRFADQLSVRAG
ncbi:hypothetical protein BIWAKO_03776 [Bosea sp. BIWAKO-01]|nr:hypothetical protein BIWAKO_03776 [Bosea sp. BIWAKO-01]